MKGYTHLKEDERKEMFLLRRNGTGIRSIAELVGRDKSTVSRELRRNTIDREIGYNPSQAGELAKQRRKVCKTPKILRYRKLRLSIKQKLCDGWSPEQISGRQKRDKEGQRVCHETIYRYIYSDIGREEELYKHLAKARPKRGLKQTRKQRPSIPNRVSVHKRSTQINKRREFGHLEGDLTFFAESTSENVTTLIERKSRFTMLVKNGSKRSAVVIGGIMKKLLHVPKAARKSITFDNGTEFTYHEALKGLLPGGSYFCDPGRPDQKGQVENTNARIHRFIPKKSSIKSITQGVLDDVEQRINNRPMKVLGFKTPAEVFRKLVAREERKLGLEASYV